MDIPANIHWVGDQRADGDHHVWMRRHYEAMNAHVGSTDTSARALAPRSRGATRRLIIELGTSRQGWRVVELSSGRRPPPEQLSRGFEPLP